MDKKDCLLAIIIPMYNESLDASNCLRLIRHYISNIPAIRLIIVEDGSTDTTLTILKDELKKSPHSFLLISHRENKGYGAAIRTGISTACKINAQYLLFMDADLTNHPRYIKDFIRQIPLRYDYVKASRYITGGGMLGVPQYRQLFSKIGNFFSHIFFRMTVHDYTNGFRMIKREIAEKIPYTMNDFSLILEEMYYLKKMKARCTEIPYILTNRINSFSHFQYSYSLLRHYLYFITKAAVHH